MPTPDVNRLGSESRGEEESVAFGPVDEVMRGIRARLKADGPEVNYPALYAYVAGVLVEDERRLVRERIATWLDWHDAYWEIHTAGGGK